MVSEPSSFEAWLLIALDFTLGGSSSSPSYNHPLLDGGAEITRFVHHIQRVADRSSLDADLVVVATLPSEQIANLPPLFRAALCRHRDETISSPRRVSRASLPLGRYSN